MRQKYHLRTTAGIVAALIAVPVGGFPALAVVESQPIEVAGALAAPCADVESVFVRGSGEVLNDVEADRFNDQLRLRVDASVSRHHYELGSESIGGELYQAVDVGGDNWNNLWHSLGAAISAGGALEYGSSVDSGVAELTSYLTERAALCPAAVFVLGGFSQGAQVVGETYSETLSDGLRNRIAYQALFGDPKLHLPEGEGISPPACRGESYSAWRSGVPGCAVARGALGARQPYLPAGFEARTGSFCHNADFVCGSSPFFWDGDGHNTYADPGNDVDASVAEITERLKEFFPGAWANASSEGPGGQTAPVSAQGRPEAVFRQPYYYAQPGQQVTFDASVSYSPDAQATSYEWDYDGDGVFEETTLRPIATHTYAEAVDGVVRMRMTDSNGAVSSASTRLHVGTSPDGGFPTAPTAVTASRASSADGFGSVTVSWASADPTVHRWGLTVDGFPIGMVEGGARSAVIVEVRLDQDVEIGVVGFNSKGGIGAAASVLLPTQPSMRRSGEPRALVDSALMAGWHQPRPGDPVELQPGRRPRSRRDCRPMPGARRSGLPSAGQVAQLGPAVRSAGPYRRQGPEPRPSRHTRRPPVRRAVAGSSRRR